MILAYRTLVATCLLVAQTAMSDTLTYLLPVTRDGKTISRVAVTTWLGEYPMPVIDLQSTQAGTVTVNAIESPRVETKAAPCTIERGIYHPWSKTSHSVRGFFTLLPRVEYLVNADLDTAEPRLHKGDVLTQVIPLAEGQCHAVRTAPKQKPLGVELTCDDLQDSKRFTRKTSTPDGFSEQWVQLACKEGHLAFIRDTALLALPGAAEGTVIDFGAVGPAKPK